MKQRSDSRRGGRRLLSFLILTLVLLSLGFFLYISVFAHADASARKALVSDAAVTVTETEFGRFFDGPGTVDALIFYPGGKVEADAYAPLLRRLAEEELDVFLVEMPFRLAIFDADRASAVMGAYDYGHWYLCGHSLGGAIAAIYASQHAESLSGLILLAAYPTKPLDDTLPLLLIYGSEDGVLNRRSYEAGKEYWPAASEELVIAGGNHAQFGNYGAQSGDGTPRISADEQQRQTAEAILALLANDS